jgi:hypothetical protein
VHRSARQTTTSSDLLDLLGIVRSHRGTTVLGASTRSAYGRFPTVSAHTEGRPGTAGQGRGWSSPRKSRSSQKGGERPHANPRRGPSQTRKIAEFAQQSSETSLRKPNSLLTGKRTGKYSIFGGLFKNRPWICLSFQGVASKFPKSRNREINSREQGINSA